MRRNSTKGLAHRVRKGVMIANLSSNDYSNFAHTNCMALRSVGVKCDSFTLNPHVFRYSESSTVVSPRSIAHILSGYDIIQIFHSDNYLLRYLPRNRPVFVYHTGTRYRLNSDAMNRAWNPVVERCFYDSPEFHDKGAKNATYIATAIDTERFAFSPSGNKRTLYGHFPSMPYVKGTKTISSIMNGRNFVCSTNRISHDVNMKRMSECDVYIEMLCTDQGGNTYGSFGVTAFEASAMGKQVITNSLHHHVYKSTYGDCPMLIANNENELRGAVDRSGGFLSDNGHHIRQWICDTHSLQATGNYLKKYLL